MMLDSRRGGGGGPRNEQAEAPVLKGPRKYLLNGWFYQTAGDGRRKERLLLPYHSFPCRPDPGSDVHVDMVLHKPSIRGDVDCSLTLTYRV